MSETRRPMTVDEIRALATRIIALPPFEDGGEDVMVRVKRPDMISLVRSGKIPNDLMASVMQVMDPDAVAEAMAKGDAEDSVQKALQLMDTLIEATLVEPVYAELRDLLTDEQKSALVAYAGGGLRALATFRERSGQSAEAGGDSESLEQTTE